MLGVTTDFLLDDSKSEPDGGVLQTAFFRKFEKLGEDDQKKLMKIIEDWGG